MDQQTPIDLYTGFTDPYFADPTSESLQAPQPSQEAEAVGRKLENVSNYEQMDQQTPIDLYTGFTDPYFADLSSDSSKTSQEKPEKIPPFTKGSGEGALAVGTTVTHWGRGAARYLVKAFVNDLIVEITSLATGGGFTAFRSMLTPVLEGVP